MKSKEKEYKPTKEELRKFHEYYSLSNSQRKSLVATNYFRVLNGFHEIPVPEHNTEYHRLFDKKCYNRQKDYKKLKDSGGTFHRYLNENTDNNNYSDNKNKTKEPTEVIKEKKPIDFIPQKNAKTKKIDDNSQPSLF